MAKACESKFYTLLRKQLPYAVKSDRIESSTSVGFPDLVLHYSGNSAFIELKAWCGVQRYFPEIRKPNQYAWFRDRTKENVNANCWVFAKLGTTYCLYKGTTVKELSMSKRNKTEWLKLADHVWEKTLDTDEFLNIIGLNNAS